MTRTLTDRIVDRVLERGRVTALDEVTPRMLGIRLAATGLTWTPGQQVRVQTGPGLLSPRRTYSIWDYDGETVELRVLLHGDGPGTSWARGLTVGAEVLFSRPEGKFTPRAAGHHLFVGEETAAVAFGPMVRALAGATVHTVLEVDEPTDRLDIDASWHFRSGSSAASSQSLVDAVRELDLPPEPGIAYLAGEARTIQLVRTHLVRDRGWPRRAVLTKPFWTPGKRGLE